MLRAQVKKGDIGRALKELKSKFIKTKMQKQCRDNKEYTKPSVKKRNIKSNAVYKERKKRNDEI